MALRLLFDQGGGMTDAAGLAVQITLSGDYRQCCRTLNVELVSSPYAPDIPAPELTLGRVAQLWDEGELLFHGSIFTVTRGTDLKTIAVTCFDMGYFLKNNSASYSFSSMTAADITRRVCSAFGVPVHALAAPGCAITRKFRAAPLYQIIDTAYALAAEQDGKRYAQRFRGAKLEVYEKGALPVETILEGASCLQSAVFTHSADGMINRAAVYDKDGKRLLIRDNPDNPAAQYGLRTAVLTQRQGGDVEKQIRALFEENGVTQTVTVSVLAANDMVTGNAVQLREPYTGLTGRFWIDADSHRWKNGLHTAKLTLNYRNIVRKGDAGQEE